MRACQPTKRILRSRRREPSFARSLPCPAIVGETFSPEIRRKARIRSDTFALPIRPRRGCDASLATGRRRAPRFRVRTIGSWFVRSRSSMNREMAIIEPGSAKDHADSTRVPLHGLSISPRAFCIARPLLDDSILSVKCNDGCCGRLRSRCQGDARRMSMIVTWPKTLCAPDRPCRDGIVKGTNRRLRRDANSRLRKCVSAENRSAAITTPRRDGALLAHRLCVIIGDTLGATTIMGREAICGTR